MNVQDYVDYKIRSSLEGVVDPGEIVQVTLRIPLVDRLKADVVAAFIDTTRNALFTAILQDGLDVAFDRVKQNPVASNMTINGKTPDQAYQALLAGESFFGGPSPVQVDDYLEQANVRQNAFVREVA